MCPLEIAFFNNLAGDNSEEATPDPIPNSEVKLFSVDGTAWVTMWESRSLPAFFVFFDFDGHLRRQLQKKRPVTYRVRAWALFSCFLASAPTKSKKKYMILLLRCAIL